MYRALFDFTDRALEGMGAKYKKGEDYPKPNIYVQPDYIDFLCSNKTSLKKPFIEFVNDYADESGESDDLKPIDLDQPEDQEPDKSKRGRKSKND